MKKTILTAILLLGLISVKGQIFITADSMVTSKSYVGTEKLIPETRVAESLSLEIDKDLLTLRVFGKGHEHAIIENAYIIDLLEVDNKKMKWLFQGSDRNCISYTITLDLNKKSIDFITFGKEPVNDRPLSMVHYHIVDIKINNDAIDRHLKEKENNKI